MDSSYINDLSMDEKIIFVKLLCKLIKADDEVAQEELSFLKSIAAHFGVDNATTVSIVKSIAAIDCMAEAKKITNRKHALELIKELCVLANIDENLDDKELDIIIDIAEAMNIEDEKIVLINRWVLNSIILNKAGKIIMEKEDE